MPSDQKPMPLPVFRNPPCRLEKEAAKDDGYLTESVFREDSLAHRATRVASDLVEGRCTEDVRREAQRSGGRVSPVEGQGVVSALG